MPPMKAAICPTCASALKFDSGRMTCPNGHGSFGDRLIASATTRVQTTEVYSPGLYVAEQLELLYAAGYEAAPEKRRPGGPFCVKAPDGRYIYEGDFTAELERVAR